MFGHFYNLLYSLYDKRLVCALPVNSEKEIEEFNGYTIIKSPDDIEPFRGKVVRMKVMSHWPNEPKLTNYYTYIIPTDEPDSSTSEPDLETGLTDITYILLCADTYASVSRTYLTRSGFEKNIVGMRLTTREEKVNIIKNTGFTRETQAIYDRIIYEMGY